MARIFNFSNNTTVNGVLPAGWYQQKNSPSDQVSLLIGNSTHDLAGVMRFNDIAKPPQFEGFNGNSWVQFNAIKWDKGDKGADFNNVVKLANVGDGAGLLLSEANITISSEPVLNCRSLKAGSMALNGVSADTMKIATVGDSVVLSSLPQPMEWNFAGGVRMFDDCGNLCAYGDVAVWPVSSVANVSKGQAVRLTGVSGANGLFVEPLVYQMPINPYKRNCSFYGIALQDGKSGDNIRVCSRGITAVRVSSNIPKEFIATSETPDYGVIGLVAPDGFIFYSPAKPMVDSILAGVFLQSGNLNSKHAGADSGYVRFKI